MYDILIYYGTILFEHNVKGVFGMLCLLFSENLFDDCLYDMIVCIL